MLNGDAVPLADAKETEEAEEALVPLLLVAVDEEHKLYGVGDHELRERGEEL
eukprot:CAMPEP_0180704476 /NCGR_PEP_ID=MMETSP1038_2-20121128/7169_1 /TAXON_ID=632150 /ORGANISM="Azadinium spinosum, Strain 3D9" /LENGTH=51 /DNA_ID=CAMNT_0022736297 /DNA_START=208 /DNA_END=363 /DNA_ORIENTATION=+